VRVIRLLLVLLVVVAVLAVYSNLMIRSIRILNIQEGIVTIGIFDQSFEYHYYTH
jgi:hypothetical protein